MAAIKAAKYYELDGRDVIFTPLTDSMDLYGSRLEELREERGPYTRETRRAGLRALPRGHGIDYLQELGYHDRKAAAQPQVLHLGRAAGQDRPRSSASSWEPDFWTETFAQVEEWDGLIQQFNERTGLLKTLD